MSLYKLNVLKWLSRLVIITNIYIVHAMTRHYSKSFTFNPHNKCMTRYYYPHFIDGEFEA